MALERLEIDDPRWRRFVATHPDALAPHHPEWARLLADCYALEPFALAALDANGDVQAGLPVIAAGGHRRRTWVSLPFTDYCPPLSSAAVPPATLAAQIEDARLEAGVGSIEVRSALETGAAPPPAVGFRHVLELPDDPVRAYAGFHPSQVQRAIRKVEREHALELRVAASRDDLAEVYYGLHLDSRRRHGTPVQPRRFFRLLWERMIEPGLGFVLIAYAGGVAVAGAVFLQSHRSLLYKYAASDPAALRLRPNHLVIWTAIQRACGESLELIDFGRTELAHSSLATFKRSWGASEEPLIYSRLSEAGISGAQIKQHPRVNAVIRRSPRLLCRVTGELLYRYAA